MFYTKIFMNRVKPAVASSGIWLVIHNRATLWFWENVWGGSGIDNGVWNQVISATLPLSGIHKRHFSDRVVDLLKITNNPLCIFIMFSWCIQSRWVRRSKRWHRSQGRQTCGLFLWPISLGLMAWEKQKYCHHQWIQSVGPYRQENKTKKIPVLFATT